MIQRSTEERDLNERQKRFCWEFVHGEHAGNATQSYLVVYKESSVSSAGVCSSALLKDARVARLLAKYRNEAMEKRLRDLRPWNDLLG